MRGSITSLRAGIHCACNSDFRRHDSSHAFLVLVISAFIAMPARAQDSGINDTFSQSNVDLQLQVVPGCSVTQPNGSDFGTLDFGTHTLLLSAVDQQVTMTFSLQCATGVTATILLNGGTSGNVASRAMTRNGGSETIGYQLYLDSGRSTVWDNTTGLAVAGNGQSASYPVYGRVNTKSNPVSGVYKDTVVVTINF